MTNIDLIAAVINGHPAHKVDWGNSYVEKCAGCPWQGWHHHRHVAEEIDKALWNASFLNTVEELKNVHYNQKVLSGPIIRAMGAPAFGDIYEGNDDGTWNLLGENSSVPPEDVPLPAHLIYQPSLEKP